MADTMITRCPDCGTAFQISQAQLDAACGSVRCGSCLHIFDASAYLVVPDPEPAPPAQPEPPPVQPGPGPTQVDPEGLTADGQPLPKPAPGRPSRPRPVPSATRTAPSAPAATTARPPPPASPPPRAALPEEVTQQPLELEARRPPRWPRLLGWAVLNVTLLALLAGQVVYLKFDDLRVHPTLGGWLEQACGFVDCPRPVRNEVRLLRAEQLVVRTHPAIQGALQVDAVIINRARFTQPYPVIELEFSDISGEKVAGRKFTPDEYLSDYREGEDFMAPGDSRHVSLGITDPGEIAVNYMITLHPLNPR